MRGWNAGNAENVVNVEKELNDIEKAKCECNTSALKTASAQKVEATTLIYHVGKQKFKSTV